MKNLNLLLWSLLLGLGPIAGRAIGCDVSSPQNLDGTCNNLNYPNQGAANTFYRRGAEGVQYQDGVQEKVTSRPNERVISNQIADEDPTQAAILDSIPHNMLAVSFGQFLNHDFESNDQENLFVIADPQNPGAVFELDIPVTEPDDDFCFFQGVNRCDPSFFPKPVVLYRASAGEILNGQFEVRNKGTSYIDLDTVYGANDGTGSALRDPNGGGRLLTEDYKQYFIDIPGGISVPVNFQDLPPTRSTTQIPEFATALFPLPDTVILSAGDFRVNENIGLTSMHVLFLREHNRLADEIAAKHGSWTDEEIFQQARRINIAQYQNIVMYEYLPQEFGDYFFARLGRYKGYNSGTDASTGTLFATAAFRYGHSTVRAYPALEECGGFPDPELGPAFPPGSDLPNIGQTAFPVSIFFQAFLAGSFENAIRGLIAATTKPVDTFFDDNVRSIIFPGGGADLMTLDIQRGRNNGIPNFNDIRKVYNTDGSIYGKPGCPAELDNNQDIDPEMCFNYVTARDPLQPSQKETDLALALKDLNGKVNNIDAIVGLLSEPSATFSTSFGETIGTIIIDQYKRSRDGDRFWFEHVFSGKELKDIRSVTMKTVLQRNFDFNYLPDDVFFSPADFAGDLMDVCAESSSESSSSE